MPQLVATEKKKWTYQESLQLGEETRCEIIQGELTMPPSPNLEHQDISRDLGFSMAHYIQEKKLGKIFYAPIDVVLDETNVVQPDIVFVAKPNLSILRKRGIFGAPDLVVEILSPSSIRRDRYEKLELYAKFCVKEYWIVDPYNQSIEVLCWEGTGYSLFSFASEKGKVKSKVLEGFEVEIGSLMVFDYKE
jgi:Uma2 family endonuclease